MCVYQATQDGSWGLNFTRCFNHAFKFCRDDATRESYVAALFDCFSSENLRIVSTLTNMNSLPIGVVTLSKSSFAFFALYMHVKILSGARPALPMGVALEAIVENLLRV
jgi:hypothetical protein